MTNSFSGPVDIGGRALYATVRGEGPPVVLNSGGGRESIGTWGSVESEVAKFAKVIVYDRAGLGRSDAAPDLPTAADMVSDLRALLRALHIAAPALLVGTSLSALMVQLYASKYPDEVSALLLLDPTPGLGLEKFERHSPQVQESIRQAMLENAAGLGMSEHGLSEIYYLPESCAQLAGARSEQASSPNIPVTVVSALKPPAIAVGKMRVDSGRIGFNLVEAHKSIVSRYPRGRHILAEKSSHASIVTNEPDLVVNAIRSLLDRANMR